MGISRLPAFPCESKRLPAGPYLRGRVHLRPTLGAYSEPIDGQHHHIHRVIKHDNGSSAQPRPYRRKSSKSITAVSRSRLRTGTDDRTRNTGLEAVPSLRIPRCFSIKTLEEVNGHKILYTTMGLNDEWQTTVPRLFSLHQVANQAARRRMK
jgi:hypothetical protein